MQGITPCLWFDMNAEEAIEFYKSVFPDVKVHEVSHYTEAGPAPAGTVMVVMFEVLGQRLMALNGGPEFKFTEAISLMVTCDSQDEVDELWAKLTANGGEESQCGWLKDKYGLSWQIVPSRLLELTTDPDPQRAARAMQAMLQMRKIDIAEIERAADAVPA